MSELNQDVKVDFLANDNQLAIVAGNMLREARQAKGLAADAMAASLKVSVKKIEAIESGRFDLLPDLVFARALACSICRNLKIDAAPILEHFPPTIAPNLKNDETGINTPFHSSQRVSRFKVLQTISRPASLFLIVLLLLALTLYAFPLLDTSKLESLASSTVSKINSPGQMQDIPLTQGVVPIEQMLSTHVLFVPSQQSVNEGVVVSGLGGTTGNIVFKSRGVSWVEVLDANGTVQLRKTLISGEVVGASGALPLAVVVGKADSLDITVAGKPFNLMAVSKDNVARFSVN
jgi:cytoskeleton protein RodZ